MYKNKTLYNFPEAFQPIVVVIGDRREDPPKTMADLLAYSVSSSDILFLKHLNIGKVDILSDKIFILEDFQTLKRKYGNTNLLVIGSPAVNLLSRKINNDSIFHFNISKDAKNKLKLQENILDNIKFDQESLSIYRDILFGATSINELLIKFKHRPSIDKELKIKCKNILEQYKSTDLKRWKDLMHEFDRPGIFDPIDNTIHGASPKPYFDYGLISIAKNPFSDSNNFVSVYVAGVHAPGTAHCIKLLSNSSAFAAHPYGGVIEIEIDLYKGWTDRLYSSNVNWQTHPYEENDERIPIIFIKLIYPNAKSYENKKEIFISSQYDEYNNSQKKFNTFIESCFHNYHKLHGYLTVCVNPYTFKPALPFVGEIIKKFKKADYIIHDTTNFSKGVLFEVGVSYGLKKYLFLIWNNSVEKFESTKLPKLLKGVNIITVDSRQRKKFEEILNNQIFETGLELTDKSPCFLTIGDNESIECSEEKKSDKSNAKERAYIHIPLQYKQIRNCITNVLKDYRISILKNYELPTKDILSRTCCGIIKAKYCFIDISDSDLDGIINLGFAKGLGRGENTLMLYRETADTEILSMWEGLDCEWYDDSYETDIKEKVSELIQCVRSKN